MPGDCIVEHCPIAPPGNFNGTKAAQMIGHELRVEQHETACDQAGHQMNQRDLRGVALGVKHAFTEECAAKADAIESWFELVDLEYGGQWSSFAVSAAKSVKCSQSGMAWGCEVRAIPCSR